MRDRYWKLVHLTSDFPLLMQGLKQNLGVEQTLRQQIIPWYFIKAQCMIHHFLRKTLPFTFQTTRPTFRRSVTDSFYIRNFVHTCCGTGSDTVIYPSLFSFSFHFTNWKLWRSISQWVLIRMNSNTCMCKSYNICMVKTVIKHQDRSVCKTIQIF